MADPKLLEMLAEGPEAWNRYRAGHDPKRLDLNDADLRGRDLAGMDLRNAALSNADLSGAILRGANLSSAYAVAVKLVGADLSGAKIHNATFSTGFCDGASFIGASGSKSSFSNATLDSADFTGARLRRAHFDGASLHKSIFREAFLTGTVFWDSEFTQTEFNGAVFDGTVIGSADLREAIGLAEIVHDGPSCLDSQTLLLSPHLPEVFLKGVGLPDTLIAYYDSLAASGRPIQWHSVFISYSSKDEEFCRRLHADLQATGVRCWFAPEDLKIGDRSRTRIEESIRIYDKLLIVLSEHAISSPWVEHEIEAAFEKERQRKATVLFPIRVDDAVMDTNQAWAASIRRERHIGNFTGWKNHDVYQKAFERLMRDLRASEEGNTPAASV